MRSKGFRANNRAGISSILNLLLAVVLLAAAGWVIYRRTLNSGGNSQVDPAELETMSARRFSIPLPGGFLLFRDDAHTCFMNHSPRQWEMTPGDIARYGVSGPYVYGVTGKRRTSYGWMDGWFVLDTVSGELVDGLSRAQCGATLVDLGRPAGEFVDPEGLGPIPLGGTHRSLPNGCWFVKLSGGLPGRIYRRAPHISLDLHHVWPNIVTIAVEPVASGSTVITGLCEQDEKSDLGRSVAGYFVIEAEAGTVRTALDEATWRQALADAGMAGPPSLTPVEAFYESWRAINEPRRRGAQAVMRIAAAVAAADGEVAGREVFALRQLAEKLLPAETVENRYVDSLRELAWIQAESIARGEDSLEKTLAADAALPGAGGYDAETLAPWLTYACAGDGEVAEAEKAAIAKALATID